MGVFYMSIENAIKNACTSVEMEGYNIDDECKEWCRLLLNGDITFEQYISFVKDSLK